MNTLQLKKDLYWAGILDKDLRVFDIIMMTEFGTTYNSYILKCGDKTVLFETAKAKFFDQYEKAISEKLDVENIDYIVVDHTEPDHAGSLQSIIEKCPRAKIIATPTAIGFLKQIVNRDFYSIAVKDKDELRIGDKTLRFYSLPNLHWPDSMYTYIVEDKVLVTCDSFGSHYAHDGILRSTVTDEEGYMRATKYYFDNILGPFKQPYMTAALDVVKSLEIDMICTGHGPVLDSHIEELIQIYEEWCKVPVNEKKTVVMPYVSAYGYTGELAEKIADGIRESGDIEVKIYDMVTADPGVVLGEIAPAEGILFGTPTILGDALKPIWDLATSLYSPIHGGKLASAFGSYGWSGEGVPHLIERLKQLNMRVIDGYRVQFKPSEKELLEAFEFGYRFGQKLQQKEMPKKSGARSTLVKCLVCGEILDSSLDRCPVCGVGPENFAPIEVETVAFYKESLENFVILGGGTAALNAAKAIRERNKTAKITMVSEEKELPYDRPMLTKNMFGALSGDAIASEDRAWYEDNQVIIKLGTKVEKLDTQKKEAHLSNGEVLPYDKCVYALGANSFVPPIKGKDLEGVTAIRTISDVEKVSHWALNAKSAVVIGGGVLGLEAAWELRKEKLQVTVLEGAPVLMAGKIDSEAVEMLTKIASDQGIRIVTGAKISELSGNGKVESVLLDGGESIPADIVIISTGVRASIALANEAGITCDRAVVVDEAMRTNLPDVYACGDCAQYQGMNIAIWPVASEMGRIAGANAAGDSLTYSQKTYGVTLAALGTMLYAIGDPGSKEGLTYKTMQVKDERKGILEKYYFLNNTICGAILLGDTSNLAKVTEAIEEMKSFGEFFK
ncbi:MAG: FAD-dependent oxidoreductase [Anaerotignum propionicum]|uniref:FAD-dependent oxidoreductase n=1 Tax=Anaerotignum propionicum TaxID=28446 RepID=UPI002B1F8690|nr:FAD-dependent oxidoreductase [Anaerotignum propionicum]MEA5056585.1 FAD-dependent oxidoreductase [Anaerotignum propionicum]